MVKIFAPSMPLLKNIVSIIFYFFDIESWENEVEAYEAETFWIEYFRSYRKEIGYNESMGGFGFLSGINHPLYGTHPSQETRQKLSKASKGRVPPNLGKRASKETKLKMSKDRVGQGNAMYGKHHSEKGKLNISQAKIASDKNKGEKHYLAVFTSEQVNEIRKLFVEGKMKKSEIAKLYNARWLAIHRIITNQTYKN